MRYCLVLLLLVVTLSGFGQRRIPSNEGKEEKKHSPTVATLLSTFVPGAGQLYNRKYWKVPVIYGAGATLIYFVGVNNKLYKKYSRLYEQKLDETIDDLYVNIDEESLRRERENWRRNRDLNYIGLGVLYFLQVIDANVDAHLFQYDISDDLTFRYYPDYVGGMADGISSKSAGGLGMKLTINF
jgi:hypothetical protein